MNEDDIAEIAPAKPPLGLCQNLARGWSAQSGIVDEFLRRWKDLFGTPTAILQHRGTNTFEFATEIGSIKLRGMSDILCLGMGGDGLTCASADIEIWRSSRALGRMVFLLFFSEASRELLRNRIPRDRCLVLDLSDIQRLISSADACAIVKQLMRNQFPLRRLIPFDIGHSPQAHMFFGRRQELNTLLDDEQTSYAVVGPLGIGKTALMSHFESMLIRRRDPRAQRRFYVNFALCTDTDEDKISQFIAMSIKPSYRSYNLNIARLYQFLRKEKHELGGPLELLLDDVDDFCQSKALQILVLAMRENVCRLILAGRGLLQQAISHTKSPLLRRADEPAGSKGHPESTLERRIELIHMRPLDPKFARELIEKPLYDLGLHIERPQEFFDQILKFTGCLPHLLQFMGRKIAELAVSEGIEAISMRHLDDLRWSFEAAQFFTDPLRNFDTPDVKLIALCCLRQSQEELTVAYVQDLARAQGFDIEFDRTREICDELVINNVLSWGGTGYCMATGALSYYARDLGYLDRSFCETKKVLGLKQ